MDWNDGTFVPGSEKLDKLQLFGGFQDNAVMSGCSPRFNARDCRIKEPISPFVQEVCTGEMRSNYFVLVFIANIATWPKLFQAKTESDAAAW